jgi:non-specific serine/threonine protein kinase
MSRKLELGLTPRELQVARLVRDGLTDRDIAERLFITRRTAEWHLKQIFNKLGFNSRSQVAAWVAHDQAVGSQAGSSDRRRHNLPLQLTRFVGRGSEVAEIQRLLATKRLVTLTAVGGVGKTRLALEVANRALDAYPDGAWLVDLTLIKDGHLVARVFGSTLGVHERPRQPIAETLLEHLRGRHLLLVLDNCEHVIENSAGLVDKILRSCEGITFLATSREPLRVNGETVWRVAPLAIPDPVAPIHLPDLARCEAVDLFLDRAQLAAPGFEMTAENALAVAQLCARLDGIPLAIELAASRAGHMSPEQILNRLQDRFGLLTSGSRAGPTRHRSLQAALDWSYDLLSTAERMLFPRLSVFAGSFSLEAVEQVCCGDDLDVAGVTDLLGSLVDKSLVIAAGAGSGPIRFRMLETLQQFGYERLTDEGDVERLNERQSEFFVSLAEGASPQLKGREQQAWHRRLAEDIGNLRLALDWSSGREPERNLRLSVALTHFWHIHGLDEEGDACFKRVLAEYRARNQFRAQALEDGGVVAYWRDDFSGASARWHECLDLYRELGDQKGVGRALARVGELAEWHGDFEKAHRYYDDGLAMSRGTEDAEAIAKTLNKLGRLATNEGDHKRARTYLEESIATIERTGDLREILIARGYLGLNAVESGDLAAARAHLAEAIRIAHSLDFTFGIATTLMYFAALAAAQSHPVRALHIAGSSESLGESTGGIPIRITKPIVQRWLDRSRRELGPKRSAACWAAGRAMTRERAIVYALKG